MLKCSKVNLIEPYHLGKDETSQVKKEIMLHTYGRSYKVGHNPTGKVYLLVITVNEDTVSVEKVHPWRWKIMNLWSTRTSVWCSLSVTLLGNVYSSEFLAAWALWGPVGCWGCSWISQGRAWLPVLSPCPPWSSGAALALVLGTSMGTGMGWGQAGAGLWGAGAWPCCSLAGAGAGGPGLLWGLGPGARQRQERLEVPVLTLSVSIYICNSSHFFSFTSPGYAILKGWFKLSAVFLLENMSCEVIILNKNKNRR